MWRLGEVEQIHQIPDGRSIQGPIRIGYGHDRVRQIVATTGRDGREIPVALDELQQRHMVIVGMVDKALFGPWRRRDEWNTGAVTEEIQRLDITGVIITAALV